MKKKIAITLGLVLGAGLCSPSGMVYAAEPNVGVVENVVENATDSDAVVEEGILAEEDEKKDATATSGKFGESITWSFDATSKTLTVKGKGDFPYDIDIPWTAYETKMENVVISSGITNIRTAFSNNTTIKKVVLADTVNAFDFGGCSNLLEIKVPGAVKDISNAFYGCAKLKKVELSEGIERMNGAFRGCKSLVEITIPASVSTMYDAFIDCTNLETVNMIESDTQIYMNNAFINCVSLKNIDLVDNVCNMQNAFNGCTSLEKIHIPDSINYNNIYGAFNNCTGLKEINLPACETTINSNLADSSFYGCSLNRLIIPNTVRNLSENTFSKFSVKELVYNGTYEEFYRSAENIPQSGLTDKWFSGRLVINGTAPSAPVVLNTSEGLKLAWAPVEYNFDGYDGMYLFSDLSSKDKKIKYKIYRKTDSTGWKAIGTADGATYKDEDVVKGTKYYYTVSAVGQFAGVAYETSYDKKGTGKEFTGTVDAIVLETPVLRNPTNTKTSVMVNWNPVIGADQYKVFKKNAAGNWVMLAITKDNYFEDTNVVSGETYTYTVRCLSEDGKTYTSSYNKTGKTIKFVEAPVITNLSNTISGTSITWGSVKGAEKYSVYKRLGTSSWQRIAIIDGTTYEDKDVTSGVKYTYTVRCTSSDGKKHLSSYYNTGKKIVYIAAPTITSVAHTAKGAKVTWDKVPGAVKYRVFRKTGSGSWTKICDTTELVYEDTTVVSGNKYAYTVRCINEGGTKYTSAYNKTGKSIKYLIAPVLKSVVKTTKGIKVTWEKVEGAALYRVYRKTGSGSWEKITDTEGVSFEDVNVTKGKTYTYTVRCINANGKTVESTYDTAGMKIAYK